MPPDLTLALPAYNEQDNILRVLAESVEALNDLGLGWEILVIDNCSSDRTPELVTGFAAEHPSVRLIRHETNRYYSGSCRTALQEARGEYLAIMDSDGQFTARDLPVFLREARAGAQLVFGWRVKRHDPLSRIIASAVFNRLGRWMLGYPFNDLNVGIRLVHRSLIRAARVEHAINMANPELFVRARQAGLRVAEVPVQHFARLEGRSCHDIRKLASIYRTTVRYFRALKADLAAGPAGIAAPPAARAA